LPGKRLRFVPLEDGRAVKERTGGPRISLLPGIPRKKRIILGDIPEGKGFILPREKTAFKRSLTAMLGYSNGEIQ